MQDPRVERMRHRTRRKYRRIARAPSQTSIHVKAGFAEEMQARTMVILIMVKSPPLLRRLIFDEEVTGYEPINRTSHDSGRQAHGEA